MTVKYFSLLAYFLVSLFLFSACSFIADDNGPALSPSARSYIFASAYQPTWEATRDSLATDHLVLKSEDESYLITEERPFGDVSAADKIGFETEKYRYKYSVHLLPYGKAETEVRIAVQVRHITSNILPVKDQRIVMERALHEMLLDRVCDRINRVGHGTCSGYTPAAKWISLESAAAKEKTDATRAEAEQVAAVQTALVNRGYDPGVIDGIMGKKTRGALNHLQADLGLPVTGAIDAEVLRALGLQKESGNEERVSGGGDDSSPEEQQPADAEAVEEVETVITPAPREEFDRQGSGIVTQSTYLMRNASIMAESVIEIPQGTALQLLERKGSFFKTIYRGRHGYVYDRSIQTTDIMK